MNMDEIKKMLEEIKRMEAEMHEAEKDLTLEERKSLIYGTDDEIFEIHCRKD